MLSADDEEPCPSSLPWQCRHQPYWLLPCTVSCPLHSTHRLEATYEIREDIADVLGRVGAFWDDSGNEPVVS